MIRLKTTFLLFVLLFLVSFTPSIQKASINKSLSNEGFNELQQELDANKGHLVLINFWASYHANSRIENIKFANLMKNNNGFVVISVSLDAYQSVFEETVKRDGLSCVQNIHATNGFDSKLANKYKLGNDFGNLLLDAKGKVLAKNLTPDELKAYLQN
jgi:thiol-disulfide isomerase/thioredoxin